MQTITDSKIPAAFIDQNCIFNFQGKSFESGGAFLAINKKTGKLGGILYANSKEKIVSNWHGTIKINAKFGKVFNSNFYQVKRQYCWFTYQGKNFIGINYNCDWQDCISVREIR